MLADISQYYYGDNSDSNNQTTNELRYGYKRRMTDEVEIKIIAECYICGSVMTDECEVVTYNTETFCGHDCEEEYIKMIGDGEL